MDWPRERDSYDFVKRGSLQLLAVAGLVQCKSDASHETADMFILEVSHFSRNCYRHCYVRCCRAYFGGHPEGLLEGPGGRHCDLAARAHLGEPSPDVALFGHSDQASNLLVREQVANESK